MLKQAVDEFVSRQDSALRIIGTNAVDKLCVPGREQRHGEVLICSERMECAVQ